MSEQSAPMTEAQCKENAVKAVQNSKQFILVTDTKVIHAASIIFAGYTVKKVFEKLPTELKLVLLEDLVNSIHSEGGR